MLDSVVSRGGNAKLSEWFPCHLVSPFSATDVEHPYKIKSGLKSSSGRRESLRTRMPEHSLPAIGPDQG